MLKMISRAIVATSFLFAGASMAQTVEQLGADKAKFEAQKARDEAEKAAIEMAAALKAAQATAAGQLSADEQAAQRKKTAEAEKAALDAEKANIDLQVANDKASAARLQQTIGAVPDAPAVTGGVTLQTGAGKTEAALLAARASADAAKAIAADLDGISGPFLVRGGLTPLAFDQWDQFDVGNKLINEQLVRAQSLFDAADANKPGQIALAQVGVREAPFLAAAGVGIDALAKLGKFFQTEYTVGNIDLTPDDALLVSDVIAKLQAKGVLVPALYLAARPGTTILPILNATAASAQTAIQNAATADRNAAALKTEAEKASDAAAKVAKLAAAAKYETASVAAKAAVAAFEGFSARVLQADDKGKLPITAIAEQKVVADALAAGRKILFVHAHFAGGSYYTYKNLWTFLGAMPFRISGAVVASYTLVDGATGTVARSGSVRISGGFKTMRQVAEDAAPATSVTRQR